MNKTLEGMARTYEGAWDLLGVELEPSDRMRAALLWLADQMEENGDAVKHCKLAAVSAYLERGQEGRAMVEPVRLMKAISAALRAAGDGR
jgi:hypothetical protein